MLATGQCYGWINPSLEYLLSPDSQVPMDSTQLSWIVAVIEVGSIISSLPAALLCDYFGRKPVILAAAPLYIAGWLIVLTCHTPLMLGVARLMHGLALALPYTCVPIYLGEIAGKDTRGALTSLFSTSWWAGFLVSYIVGPYLTYRNFTWFSLALNIPVLIFFFWQPESPYFYAMVGNDQDAYESLKWFRSGNEEDLKAELYEIIKSVEQNRHKNSFGDIISTPVDRKALVLINILYAVRTMSGITSFLVFSTQIFLETPDLSLEPTVITVVFGVVMLLAGFVATFTADSVGRRPLLLGSSVGCMLCQAGLAGFYFLLGRSPAAAAYSWLSPTLVLLYALLCSAGMYPVASAYISELFTSNTRGLASSVACINVTVVCFVALVTFQPITDSVGLYGNFALFAAMLLLGSVYFYVVAPETKGKSFSQIREEFGR